MQANIDGAVTADDPLPVGAVLLGAGDRRITTLSKGKNGQVLKADGQGLAWADDLDTRVEAIANDPGKVFTGLADHTTITQTDVADLKLTGYTASKTAEGGITPADTLGRSLSKLGEALAGKTNKEDPIHAEDSEKLGGVSAKHYLQTAGDASSVTVTYDEPAIHTEPKTGGTLSQIIGRIVRWIRGLSAADVGAVAKAGDTMTGLLKFKIGERTGTPLNILPGNGTSGDG